MGYKFGKDYKIEIWLAQKRKGKDGMHSSVVLRWLSPGTGLLWFSKYYYLSVTHPGNGGQDSMEYLKFSKYNSVPPSQWYEGLPNRILVIDLAKASSSLEKAEVNASLSSLFLLFWHGCFNHSSEPHVLSLDRWLQITVQFYRFIIHSNILKAYFLYFIFHSFCVIYKVEISKNNLKVQF